MFKWKDGFQHALIVSRSKIIQDTKRRNYHPQRRSSHTSRPFPSLVLVLDRIIHCVLALEFHLRASYAFSTRLQYVALGFGIFSDVIDRLHGTRLDSKYIVTIVLCVISCIECFLCNVECAVVKQLELWRNRGPNNPNRECRRGRVPWRTATLFVTYGILKRVSFSKSSPKRPWQSIFSIILCIPRVVRVCLLSQPMWPL